MLSIKRIYNQIFRKNNQKEETIDFDKDSVVMSVGLTPDYEIDLSIEIKELEIKNKQDLELKAQKIASFFYTVTSGGLNKTILEFLLEILPDKENKQLFESIVYNWLLLEQKYQTNQHNQNKDVPVVEPSKAFIPYFTNNK